MRRALADRDAVHDELVAELKRHHPDGASLLDCFSGRAMIPLEAARLGVRAFGIDYSPVATVAGALLADYPLRDWSGEPALPFADQAARLFDHRLLNDVAAFLHEVGRRYDNAMSPFYPQYQGRQPWGYVWAATLPCQECGERFPVTGSLVLRHPLAKTGDPGQSYRILADRETGTFEIDVHAGPPDGPPTLTNLRRGGKAVPGKVAICSFCEHVHPLEVHGRLAREGLCEDALLIAADLDDDVGKLFRLPTDHERAAYDLARAAVANQPPFGPGVPAVPDERIPPGNNHTVQASYYGAKTYGDMCNERQTLGFIAICRAINELADELRASEISDDYIAALSAYAASVVVRKLRRATRGAVNRTRRDPKSNRVDVKDVFASEAHIAFSYDYFEAGLGDGPATWSSLVDDTLAVLRNQLSRPPGRPATIRQGSAIALPFRDGTLDAVVTDPPYDQMIPYSDASDLFFVWLKRALYATHPHFAITSHPNGVQEKTEEIIVKKNRKYSGDHRTPEHYDRLIAQAFDEARRVVGDDGVVTIVFGHGEFEVWHRLLAAVRKAGLVLTGSWPARTEASGGIGSANIVTTLTLACRPAPVGRPVGRLAQVDAAVRRAVRERVPLWESAGLALTDELMASAGPAMEVAGRYDEIRDHTGAEVGLERFLLVARRTVEEAAEIKIDQLPLEAFDARTKFALFWARLFQRSAAAKSEARWQAMASELRMEDLDGILVDADKGTRLALAQEVNGQIDERSAIIDVALALARSWPDGVDATAEVLAQAGRDRDDEYLWAAMTYLSARLPESDADRIAWAELTRNRRVLRTASRDFVRARRERGDAERQESLFT